MKYVYLSLLAGSLCFFAACDDDEPDHPHHHHHGTTTTTQETTTTRTVGVPVDGASTTTVRTY